MAADFPVGVAEMVVDDGILRPQLHRSLEILDRLFVVAEPVQHPAHAVDDIAVVPAQIDRALDHLASAFDVLALLDPGISEIVQDVGLIRLEFERLQQVLFRSEEHTSELQSLMRISYAVFCLKKQKQKHISADDTHKTKTLRRL